MNDINEQLKEAIASLTDEQLDYVIMRVKELLAANEDANEDQQEEAQQYE